MSLNVEACDGWSFADWFGLGSGKGDCSEQLSGSSVRCLSPLLVRARSCRNIVCGRECPYGK